VTFKVSRRGVETVLVYWTLVVLAIYIPVETLGSWPRGLLNPYYLIDAVSMVLLLWGAVHSLRSRPRRSPEILCIAYAWSSANGWRATAGRLREIESGGTLQYGSAEVWTVGIATALSLLVLAALLVLVVSNQRDRSAGQ
jgi:hypothetical protein